MRVIQKTSYDQDIRYFEDLRAAWPYAALAVIAVCAPFLLGTFYVKELSLILLLAIGGLGLMVLVGYTGMVSLGHGAILGVGAYLHAFLLKHGVPFLVSVPLTGLITALVCSAFAFPALRLTGMYLAIATLAISFLIGLALEQWEWFTGGLSGAEVPKPTIFGMSVIEPVTFYFVCLFVLVGCMLLARNLLRSRSGRALIALRDSEIAARSMGVSLMRYKLLAFALSSGLAGVSGALLAHYQGYISPESFGFLLSIKLLILIIVGGVGSLHGAVFGAFFVGALPQITSLMKDYFPGRVAENPSFETILFGLILVVVVIWEPHGLYGRWLKIKHFFRVFPTYRKATYARQKTFAKSERLR